MGVQIACRMVLLILFLTIVAVAWAHMLWKASKLPPGPTPFPLVGNIPQFALELYREGSTIGVLQKWQKQYGSVFTFWMGYMTTVNICDWQTAQDLMVKKGQMFSNRVVPFLLKAIRMGRGVIFSNDEFWLEQRRFALHSLRNFGLGRNVMEDRIMLEVDYRSNELNNKIDSAGGEIEIDIAHMLDITVGNVINRMLFTQRFTKEKEDRFFELKGNVDRLMESANVMDLMLSERNYKFPPLKKRLERQLLPLQSVFDFFEEQIQERLQEIKEGKRELKDEPEDFVDAFMVEINNSEKEAFTSFDLESLKVTLLDLWLAGQETTATTLHWALSYLTSNPQFIEPLQKELDLVTHKTRPLSLQDRQKTPYLNAVIAETLRCSSIVPMNLWREAAQDFSIGEYQIPKGTATVAQISVIMRDEKIFPEFKKFNPQRYIDHPEYEQHTIAFGLGKRACLGESLARAELYLILGNLMCRYNFTASTSMPPGMEPKTDMGTIRRAKDYKLVINKRNIK